MFCDFEIKRSVVVVVLVYIGIIVPTFKMGVISFSMMPIEKAPFGITTVMFLLYKCAILHIMPNGNYFVWHYAKWGTPI